MAGTPLRNEHELMHFISEVHAPEYRTTPSAGSQKGLMYTTGAGTTLPNRGGESATLRTSEGHDRMQSMQEIGVQQPPVPARR